MGDISTVCISCMPFTVTVNIVAECLGTEGNSLGDNKNTPDTVHTSGCNYDSSQYKCQNTDPENFHSSLK